MEDAISLTLLNPHADDFVSTPVSFKLVGRRGLGKYKYLLDEPIRRGHRVSILVDGTLTSLMDQNLFTRLPGWLRTIILRFEIYFWLRYNNLADSVDVHWSMDTIRDRTALYVFSYKNCVGAFEQRMRTILSFQLAIINLSHYFIRTREKAKNIAKLRTVLLHADSDLSDNEYFKNFFPRSLPMLVLPFAVSERFSVKRPPMERSAKCAATGSFHNLQDEEPRAYYRDFIEFFQTYTYHPVRKLLYEHRADLRGWLTCFVSPYREMAGNNTLSAKLRRMLGLDVVQADYFSIDIVEFYNSHRFAIVGEELSGSPAIGFFEAMACGCVMLGAKGGFYNGLSLEPGVHYLTHDSTIDSIRSVIAYMSEDRQQTEAMAQAGRAYIEEHCTPQAVWGSLQRNLTRLAGQQKP